MKDIFLVGDVHGKDINLFKKLDHYEIKDSVLIHLGDNGEGFFEDDKHRFSELNFKFAQRGIEYLSIRGNHSYPKFFSDNFKLSNFELLPDYTIRTIEGIKFLFVGGAISIDRRQRWEGTNYWKDEKFVLREDLIEPVDVVISHSAPSWVGPADKIYTDDPILLSDMREERENHDRLIELAKPKKSFHGHFHRNYVSSHNGTIAEILGELEIKMLQL